MQKGQQHLKNAFLSTKQGFSSTAFQSDGFEFQTTICYPSGY